ncbi:MAG: cystathionine gamma-synthase [Anaerolineae bacterium]|jgi:cystathionine gamma-synthase|nr:MAG: cystathionine gamma-synthase [Anaerolineae bacterium]
MEKTTSTNDWLTLTGAGFLALPSASPKLGNSTQAVHGGRVENPYHSITEPLVSTATYTFENTQTINEYMRQKLWGEPLDRSEYGRYGNPTITAAEARLAALEGAQEAVLFASGMQAISTLLLSLLSAGDHLIITENLYRKTRQFCTATLPKYGITCSVVPMNDRQALTAAIRPNTRLLFSESPTNPHNRLLDIEQFVEVARQHHLLTVVDSTFATPFNLRPLEWGVDVVVHSATKYLAGHNDLLAGVVAGRHELIAGLREFQGVVGAISDAYIASLLIRGLKTLGLRIARHNENARQIAEYLAAHPAVERVWYPSLPSHPDYAIGLRQYKGFGGVVSFTVKGDAQRTARVLDALQIPLLAVSLGGCESLVSQPAVISYYELSRQERRALGIEDNLIRYSVGIEDADDLIADLEQALRQV